jgi:hypothetical protein
MHAMTGRSSAAAAGTLCVLALVGFTAVGGSPRPAATGAAPASAQPPSRAEGAPCSGAAWPYPPGACAGAGAENAAPRRVRLIVLHGAPDPR